ncbi:serine/threonine protein kinase [Capronia coronata CBS 617.96]|uniref:Serine/threonine protein kinase n=1 Tax=Capronia coronata CBS 617.96 TaxID=1182541 RepID=W9YEN0_9EURO|nr:serine/threonine protein kinase [Capronia coronata CBS 617.96]EXJ90983.1 serine/threonine protein kinase [Capronia coronata CBS 617.96]
MSSNIKFGILYPEGRGYLHVRSLGKGMQGMATLVQSVASGSRYVRKKTVADVSTLPGDACPEVSLYRAHPLIPQLIRSQEYPATRPPNGRTVTLKSHSMIFAYCNGGTLTRFLNIRAEDSIYTPSTMLVWKMFDDLLTSVYFLHQQCTPAITHNDAHSHNVFLHFPDEHAKVPDFMLGDLGLAKTIDSRVWEAEGNRGQRKLKSMQSVPAAYRESYKVQVSRLGQDLMMVQRNVGMLMTGLTPYDNHDADDIMPQLKASRHWPRELFSCYDKLDEIITPMAYNSSPGRYEEFPELCRLVRDFRRQEQQRVVNRHFGTDYRGTQPGKYDWSRIPGFVSAMEPEIAVEHVNQPQLYGSRQELLLCSRDVAGPWRIAHIDPRTNAVLGVEKLEFGYHDPGSAETYAFAEQHLIKTKVEEFGWDKIVETACKVDTLERAWQRPFQPDGRHDEVTRLFGLDPNWRR